MGKGEYLESIVAVTFSGNESLSHEDLERGGCWA